MPNATVIPIHMELWGRGIGGPWVWVYEFKVSDG